MSRSRKKFPVRSFYVVYETEKRDKQIWHRRLRVKEHHRLRALVRRAQNCSAEDLFEGFLPVLVNDVSNPHFMQKEWRLLLTRDWFDTDLEYKRWIMK